MTATSLPRAGVRRRRWRDRNILEIGRVPDDSAGSTFVTSRLLWLLPGSHHTLMIKFHATYSPRGAAIPPTIPLPELS
jgi:hypothetical protein